MRMKKIALVIILCLLFVFTGCSNNKVKVIPSGFSEFVSETSVSKEYKFEDFEKVIKGDKCIVTVTFSKDK